MATTTPVVQKAEESGKRWHGGVEETINAPIDKAWAIASNFCALNKWFKTVDRCEKVEGEYQQPGCVRYVIGNSFPRADGSKSWANEKLLTFDEENHSLSYAMLDNNLGLDGYIGHFKLQDLGEGKTLVNWFYDVNPVENQTEEAQATYMTSVYKKYLRILEDLVHAPAS